MPKPVITTERMLCTNQQMLLQTFPCFADTPPVQLDWQPWNHTFGGSHNVGIVLYNGGTLDINDGKPTPAGFVNTLHKLREITPTVYLDAPKGREMPGGALEAGPARRCAALRKIFYSKMQRFFLPAPMPPPATGVTPKSPARPSPTKATAARVTRWPSPTRIARTWA